MSDDQYIMRLEDLPPLSHSTMETFVQCPHQYLRAKIIKDVKEDFSHPAAKWGKRFHAVMESFLRDGTPIPKEFQQFQGYADRLDAIEGDRYVEDKMGVTHDGKPGRFFSNAMRFRIITDLLAVRDRDAILIDHKTGKIKPSDQLGLNAVGVFAKFPHVEEVKAAFTWIKHGTHTPYIYVRTKAEADERRASLGKATAGGQPPVVKSIEELEREKFRPIETSRAAVAQSGFWPKRPSGLCPWCPVTDCEHHE